jgi:hypothetical protein
MDFSHHRINISAEMKLSRSVTPVTHFGLCDRPLGQMVGRGESTLFPSFTSPFSTPLKVFSYGTISIYHTPCSIYTYIFHWLWQGPIYLRHSSVCANFIEKMKGGPFQPSSCRNLCTCLPLGRCVKPVLGPHTRTASLPPSQPQPRLESSSRPSADNVRMTLSSFRFFFLPSCALIPGAHREVPPEAWPEYE